MPRINSAKFGEIIIDNQKYHQVLIIGDAVLERDIKKLKQLFGTTHAIGDWEKEKLLQNNPEIILIGTGQDGALKIEDDFLSWAREHGIELISAPTPEITKIYNQKIAASEKVNALIHTTC